MNHSMDLVGESLYLLGGCAPTGLEGTPKGDQHVRAIATMSVFCMQNNKWKADLALPFSDPLVGHSTAVFGSKVLVFGGLQRSPRVVQGFDTNTMEWSKYVTSGTVPKIDADHASKQSDLCYHTCTPLKDRVLLPSGN